MISVEEERQLLLARSDQEEEAATFSKATWLSMIISSWTIYQLILLYIIFQICLLGPYSSKIELLRDLTCARYYENHPSLIDFSNEYPCSADVIEKQASWLLLACDMITGFTSALSILFFGKRFSTWGRKPILMISFLPTIVTWMVYVAIPRGYPYGPLVSNSLVTPTHCIMIVLLANVIGGSLGGETLALCCIRLMVVDNSTAANRTRNLVYLQLATMIGVLCGPLLYGSLSYILPISSSSVDNLLQLITSFVLKLQTISIKFLKESRPSIPADISNGHGNVTPFCLNVTAGLLSILYIYFFVFETAKEDAEVVNTEETSIKSNPTKVSIIQSLKPNRGADGKLDWRILSLVICFFFFMGGANGLTTYVLFFGHTFKWGPIDVDWLISSFGVTRMIVILLLLPAAVIFLEKRVKRPLALQHLSIEQIKEIAKGSSADETPSGESAFVSIQNDGDAEEAVNLQLLQGAISHWRARVDRIIVRSSWVFELLGWSTVALGAMFKEQSVMLFGGVVIGLGTGSLPALQSFGVAITSDVFAKSHEGDAAHASIPGTQGHAAEVFFALISLCESVFGVIMPLVQNYIYSSTLTIFPAAPFIAAVVYYGIAYIALSTITIHRS